MMVEMMVVVAVVAIVIAEKMKFQQLGLGEKGNRGKFKCQREGVIVREIPPTTCTSPRNFH